MEFVKSYQTVSEGIVCAVVCGCLTHDFPEYLRAWRARTMLTAGGGMGGATSRPARGAPRGEGGDVGLGE